MILPCFWDRAARDLKGYLEAHCTHRTDEWTSTSVMVLLSLFGFGDGLHGGRARLRLTLERLAVYAEADG
jgi:hypothetical protein